MFKKIKDSINTKPVFVVILVCFFAAFTLVAAAYGFGALIGTMVPEGFFVLAN